MPVPTFQPTTSTERQKDTLAKEEPLNEVHRQADDHRWDGVALEVRSELSRFVDEVLEPRLLQISNRLQADLREVFMPLPKPTPTANNQSIGSSLPDGCLSQGSMTLRQKFAAPRDDPLPEAASNAVAGPYFSEKHSFNRPKKTLSTSMSLPLRGAVMDAFDSEGDGLQEQVRAYTPECELESVSDGRRSISMFRSMLGEAARGEMTPRASMAEKPFEPSNSFHGYSKLVVTSRFFDKFVALVILANAVYIGFATEYMAAHQPTVPPFAFQVAEAVFFAVFTLEMGMRFYVFKCKLFRIRTPEGLYNHAVYWNYLEAGIILMQALETIMVLIPFGSERFEGVSLTRILRLLRLVRVLRIFKVTRHIQDMRMIIYSIWRSISLFFWSIMALVLLNFIVSIYFTEIVVASKLNGQITDATLIDPYFGSLLRTMVILFQAVSGGLDWGAVSDVLGEQAGEWAVLPFIFYVVFYQVAVLNVISGVFLDKAMEIAKAEKDIYIVRNARLVFSAVDTGRTGTITWEHFKSALAHPRMQKFFEAVDIRPTEARTLFELLDTSGDGEISADEFLNGCLRVRGHSKALDLLILSREVSHLFEKQQKLNAELGKMSKTLSGGAKDACLKRGSLQSNTYGLRVLDDDDDSATEVVEIGPGGNELKEGHVPLCGGMRKLLSEGFGQLEERLRTLEGGLQGQLNALGERVGEVSGQAKVAADTAKVAVHLHKESEKAATARVKGITSVSSAAAVPPTAEHKAEEMPRTRRSQMAELRAEEPPRTRRSQTAEPTEEETAHEVRLWTADPKWTADPNGEETAPARCAPRPRELESVQPSRSRTVERAEEGDALVRRSQSAAPVEGAARTNRHRTAEPTAEDAVHPRRSRTVEPKRGRPSSLAVWRLPALAGLAPPEMPSPKEHGQPDAQQTPAGVTEPAPQLHHCITKAIYKAIVQPPSRAILRREDASRALPQPPPCDESAESGRRGPTVTL